jgi:hypothetical protein
MPRCILRERENFLIGKQAERHLVLHDRAGALSPHIDPRSKYAEYAVEIYDFNIPLSPLF